MKTIKLAILLGTISLAVSSVRAQELGVNFSGGGSLGVSSWTLGYEFQVTSGITVDGLATYDPFGLFQDVQVGLWANDGSLITSGVVAAGTPVLAGTQFAATSIAPVYLAPGYYTVGSWDPGNAYTGAGDFAGITYAPGINFITDEYVGGGLSDPTISEGFDASKPGWFGGNIVIGAGAAPDASSTLVLLSSAALALGALRRKLA